MLASCSRAPTDDAPATRLPGLAVGTAWDWNGVIGTGQSLAVGVQGGVRTSEPSYRNLKLDLGNRVFPALDASSGRLSVVPLREPIRHVARDYPGPYPRNIYGETPHTAMATQITETARRATAGKGDYVTVHSVVGESGQALKIIGKGATPTNETGHAYRASLFEVTAIARLAREAKRTFGVSAIVLTHGETDATNPSYARGLLQLWRDYAADLPRITGQTAPIALFVSQQASSPMEAGSVAASALQVLEAAAQEPRGIVCTGPRYQYEYDDDAVHLRGVGYVRLGEKYGQAYYERVVRGGEFRALSPLSVEGAPGVVKVRFHVPVRPLAWDERLPAPHASGVVAWREGRGFELSSGDRAVRIESVTIEGDDVVVRHGEPDSSPLTVRYAATAMAAPRPGGTRRWGQLRDSDPFIGAQSRTPQPNYAVTFELPVRR
ncbi:MAG: hypothetical protein K0R38_4036 [Polyangiaceae bacterium]|nr:hypothetical protein [Polyangiaceae bacterium]